MTSLLLLETDSPLGVLRLVADGDALAGVWFREQKNAPDLSSVARGADRGVLRDARLQLAEYFAGTRRAFDLPLAPRGTPFQQRVWSALREIPFGETWSYTELASRAGHPGSPRAAGAANGRNPLGVVVPCHRVIGASGALTCYAGGLPAKRWLLTHESRDSKLPPHKTPGSVFESRLSKTDPGFLPRGTFESPGPDGRV